MNFLDTEAATKVLSEFVSISASPLVELESAFAVDSTGFSGARYLRWFDEKYGKPKSEVAWIKVHAIVGTRTNVVASAKVMDSNSADAPQFPELVEAASKVFTIKEVSADKAYCSQKNFAATEDLEIEFYPAFKKNSTGGVGGAFKKAYHMFSMNKEVYEKHYHKRSNVESTFSAIKRKFGECLRSKTDLAMKNEALAKIVANNICCVIASMYEFGIDPSAIARS